MMPNKLRKRELQPIICFYSSQCPLFSVISKHRFPFSGKLGSLLPGHTCFTIVFTLPSNGCNRAYFPHVVGREEQIESAVSYVHMNGRWRRAVHWLPNLSDVTFRFWIRKQIFILPWTKKLDLRWRGKFCSDDFRYSIFPRLKCR